MRVVPKKPAIPLVNKDNPNEIVAYACGVCGVVFVLPRKSTDEMLACVKRNAERHCPKETFCDCGVRIHPDEPHSVYKTACKECRAKRYKEKLAERRAKHRRTAIAVGNTVTPKDYSGPVYWEEEDKFFSNFDEACEAIYDDAPKEPLADVFLRSQTLWTCTVEHLALDANTIIENAIEAMEPPDGVDIDPSAEAMTELREFVRQWNAIHGVNAGDVWWESGRLILIPDTCDR